MSLIDSDREDPFFPGRETRRGLAVLVIWTTILVGLFTGAGYLAYRAYLATFVDAAASSRSASLESSPARKNREPSDKAPNARRTGSPASQTELAKPSGQGNYQVFSASEVPAISPAPPPPTLTAANRNNAAAPDSAVNSESAVANPPGERRAVAFSLESDSARTPIGPLALRLESVDAKASRYSASMCIVDKCVLLTDRVLNEVAPFSVPDNPTVFELVVTRISHNQVSGFVLLPAEK